MPAVSFSVSGDASGASKSIQVDPTTTVIKLQKLVASHFAVVEPAGELSIPKSGKALAPPAMSLQSNRLIQICRHFF